MFTVCPSVHPSKTLVSVISREQIVQMFVVFMWKWMNISDFGHDPNKVRVPAKSDVWNRFSLGASFQFEEYFKDISDVHISIKKNWTCWWQRHPRRV